MFKKFSKEFIKVVIIILKNENSLTKRIILRTLNDYKKRPT